MTVLPEFHDQLYAAAQRRARRRLPLAATRRPGRTADIIFFSLSLAITIAIVLVVLSAGSGTRVGTPNTPATQPSVASTRSELLQTLGVLRAPPTKLSQQAIRCAKTRPAPTSLAFRVCLTADLPPEFSRPQQPAPMMATAGYPRLDPSLIRVVSVPRLHASVTLAPATWQPSPRSRQRTEGLVVSIAYLNGAAGTGPTPTNVSWVRTHGLAISGGNATPQMRSVFGAVVVPDGVAKITLEPLRLISPPAPVNAHRFGTITAAVHDNVAGFRFTVPTVTDRHAKSLVYAVTVVARATWSNANGQVISRTTTQIPLWLRVQGGGPITSTN